MPAPSAGAVSISSCDTEQIAGSASPRKPKLRTPTRSPRRPDLRRGVPREREHGVVARHAACRRRSRECAGGRRPRRRRRSSSRRRRARSRRAPSRPTPGARRPRRRRSDRRRRSAERRCAEDQRTRMLSARRRRPSICDATAIERDDDVSIQPSRPLVERHARPRALAAEWRARPRR